jgi:exopolyphosphatase/guanosine-5'-triphosphate,3'-diphosphate pyrophosphatase
VEPLLPPVAVPPITEQNPGAAPAPEVIAAVDLGSNSFHMIVGELRFGQLTIIDRLRETVRLSEGLTRNGDLSPAARVRALECLSRFGERLRDMRASSVRAAGTSALRRARDSEGFREEAENALGHPIEVISGREEARLIYKGVSHSLPPNAGFRLVLDIGGGSTELILGEGNEPRALESLNMGCVWMTETYFRNGRISPSAFEEARLAARLKLRPVKAYFRNYSEAEAIGTSGTIIATESVARELGFIESNDLTPAAVEQLIEKILQFDHVDKIVLPGLPDRRAQVWPGGLAILAELLRALKIKVLRISDGALREGLLYDYLGRLQHEDARERSVRAMARRFNVDSGQSQRVSETTAMLLAQCKDVWQLTSQLASDVLGWSAALHEIGLDISHSGFQRHGAYIVENADMPGFPRAEQKILAFLIANQRQIISLERCQALPKSWHRSAIRLMILLRIAVLLNRSRSSKLLPEIKLNVSEKELDLVFPADWLTANPLTIADLDRERIYLASVDYGLKIH